MKRVPALAPVALACAFGLCALWGTPAVAAPVETIYVVVSAQSPVQGMTEKELLSLYTGRTRALAGAAQTTPFDQERNGPARAFFYQALTGMDIAQINSYWARLHFTGSVQPPQTAGDDPAMLQRLRNDPSAIGYVTQPPPDSLRVVLQLPR